MNYDKKPPQAKYTYNSDNPMEKDIKIPKHCREEKKKKKIHDR